MIKGGYILQPRKIDDSEIQKCPPHVREIWLYFLRKANHKETPNKKLQKGQLLTSYKKIIEDLSWKVGYRTESYKRHHCETAMKVLTKLNMITTAKTTRGMIVTICNYEYYQNPKNYENHKGNDIETATKPQSNRMIDKNVKNEKNEKNNIYIEFIKKFNSISDRSFKGDKKSERQFRARLKEGWTFEEFEKAIKNLYNDNFHKKNGYKWATPELITRSDKLDLYYNKQETKKSNLSHIK